MPLLIWFLLLNMWLLIFLLLPFIEVYLLVKFTLWFGFLSLLAQIVITALIGFMMLQIAQSSLLENLKSLVMQRVLPAVQMLDDLLLGIGAGLLLVPGIISDVLGLLLLIPYVRTIVAQFIKQKFRTQNKAEIIEGQFNEIPTKLLP